MEDTSNIISEKEAKLETLQQILNREAQEIGSFYGISKEKINKVADLPIREMSRKKAVHRLQKLTDINSPPALPEDETFDAVAEILGTSREKIIERRKQQRKRELENISGYYCRKNEDEIGEIILLQSGEFSSDYVVRHELIHAFRGEYEPNNDLSDEKEGVVERGFRIVFKTWKRTGIAKGFFKTKRRDYFW